MIVRCILRKPDEDGLTALGPRYFPDRDFGVKVGAEYVVLGMVFGDGISPFGYGPWITFRNVDDRMAEAPLVMFEIVEHGLSKHWEAHVSPNGVLSIGPPTFNREHYMEDYYDGVREIVEDFHRICDLLEAEARADGD